MQHEAQCIAARPRVGSGPAACSLTPAPLAVTLFLCAALSHPRATNPHPNCACPCRGPPCRCWDRQPCGTPVPWTGLRSAGATPVIPCRSLFYLCSTCRRLNALRHTIVSTSQPVRAVLLATRGATGEIWLQAPSLAPDAAGRACKRQQLPAFACAPCPLGNEVSSGQHTGQTACVSQLGL